jgi:hypothetical protein
MHETLRSGEALLQPYMAEMRASLHPEALFDSLVERLAMQQLALADLRRETAALRAALKLRDVLLPEAHVVHTPSRQHRVMAAMPLRLEDGFYPLEYDGGGQPFRWTGPSPAFHFETHLDRTAPKTLVLRLSRWGAREPEHLSVFVDNLEIDLALRVTLHGLEYTGRVVPRPAPGMTHIVAVVGRMQEAARLNPDDHRILGVPFRQLEVGDTIEPEAGPPAPAARSEPVPVHDEIRTLLAGIVPFRPLEPWETGWPDR